VECGGYSRELAFLGTSARPPLEKQASLVDCSSDSTVAKTLPGWSELGVTNISLSESRVGTCLCQRSSPNKESSPCSYLKMVSDQAIKLCQATPSVSEEFAKNPKESPTEITKRLFGHQKPTTTHDASRVDRPLATVADLERARQCGKWEPSQPSPFFLRVFHDVLSCLDADPLGGMVSPSLMGSYGTIPLTIIAPLADIFRHMANLIVRAEKEVIFITCSWSPSVASKLISDALKELSARAGRRGEGVVVKVMYDKAGAAQFVNNRQEVKPEAYSG